MKDNTTSAASMLEAVRHEAPDARVVWVSSCEVYGPPASLPLHEDAPLAPANPYAVSKAAGEMLARVYVEAHGLRIVCARPFSHAGPGQLPIFILSSLSRQAAEGRIAGASELKIVTGNPDTRRDFTDVRDIVRAYRLLAESEAVRDEFKRLLHERGIKGRIRANAAGCLDQCSRGVSVVVYPEQVWYGRVAVGDVSEIVERHIFGGVPVERLRMK